MQQKFHSMGKRFYNTQRIEEDWYINLSLKHRELLRYCESKCDGAGIFSWNAKIASSYIGEQITDSDLLEIPVSKLQNGKYFIHGFCYFQNGKLSKKSPAHNPVYKSLAENGISEDTLLGTLLHRLSDSLLEKEEEEEREEEGEGEKEKGAKTISVGSNIFIGTSSEWLKLNKQAAMDEFLMKNHPDADLNKIFEQLDSETITYHFKDANHVFNYFKGVCKKFASPPKPAERIRGRDDFYTEVDYMNYCKRLNLTPKL